MSFAEKDIPARFKLAFPPELIRSRLQQLGKLITPWAEEVTARTKHQPLAVCVLRGGAFFFCDLLRYIGTSIEPTFCRTWSYSSAINEQLQSAIRVSVEDVVAEGRAILMVDDICDTGSTLAKLQNVFTDLGASEVRSAVLIHRQVENSKFAPTWSAFEYQGSEWFVGYGMEDQNHYSNLDAVYTILP